MSLEVELDRDEYFSKTELLMRYAKEDSNNRKHLTNLIVIDLVTSLEVFTERAINQFIKKYNEINLKTCQIQDRLRLEQSKKILSELTILLNHKHKDNKSKEKLIEIQKLWSTGNNFKLDFKPELPHGKHGEIQLNNLFIKIGITDLFESFKIKSPNQSYLDETTYLDIEQFIREITEKRNIAIHEGAPLHNSVTIEILENYLLFTQEIMKGIKNRLNSELTNHQAIQETPPRFPQ